MKPERAFQLINQVTNNIWVDRKSILSEVISIANTMMVKRAKSCAYFETEREKLSNLLVQKVILHGASILSLADGISFHLKHMEVPKIKDPISMQVLFRGLLESYLTLNHFNFSKTESENEIKFKIWIQYGLRQRGKMSFFQIPVKDLNQLDNEKKQIENLLDEIRYSEFYGLLDSEKKKTFIEQIQRDWKFEFKDKTYLKFSWQQLLERTGINKKLFSGTYNFLSWFAHSSCISLFQLDEMYNLKIEKQEVINVMKETSIFIVLALTDLIKKDNELLKQYQQLDQREKDLINIYNYTFRDNNYTIEEIKA